MTYNQGRIYVPDITVTVVAFNYIAHKLTMSCILQVIALKMYMY